MQVKNIYQGNSYFSNLELLAKSIVEGYISGLHKSPFHGFSAEFSEHKIYNNGESTKHIDWKLFAKTDKLYTCLLYTSPSPRDMRRSRMPSSA